MAPDLTALSRREREIMEALWRLGTATVAEVHSEMKSPPTPTAVRSALWLLEEKGHVEHVQEGPRNVYRARVAAHQIGRTAVADMVKTFFQGSPGRAVSAILGDPSASLGDDEIQRIESLLDRHKRRRTK